MDSMEVNKGIAAVLVAGIVFFLTGMIADNLVREEPLEKSVLNIQGAPAESAAATAAAQPAELPPIAPLLAKADVGAGEKFAHTVCTACHTFNQGGKPLVGPNLYGVVGGPHDHEEGFNYSPAMEKFKGQPWTFDDAEPLAVQAVRVCAGHPHDLRGDPQRAAAGGRDRLSADAVAEPGAAALHPKRRRRPRLPGATTPAGSKPEAAARRCRWRRPRRRPPSSAGGWPGGPASRMVAAMRNRPDYLAHAILGLGVVLFALPVWLVLAGSTQDSNAIARGELSLVPHLSGLGVYVRVLTQGTMGTEPVWHMLLISLGMALAIAVGKIVISVLSAYAVVFFRFPGRQIAFWLIFVTLMLPVEVRIIPTYAVMADFGLINRFNGLWIPLIASATATLLFRQVFVAIPDELVEAARMDGAGPLRFLRDIVLPVSGANIAALFVILFVYGWNQYLWPLLVATDPGLDTIVIGIVKMIGVETQTDWAAVMATAVLALLPPVVVVLVMQRWFVAGLTEGEK